jgi:hypothetical protein
MEADHGDDVDDSTRFSNSKRQSARKVDRLILTPQVHIIKLKEATERLTERQLRVP